MNYSQYKSFKYSMPKTFLGSIIYLEIGLLINILEPYFPQFPSKYKKFNFQFSTFSIFRSFQCGRRIDEKKVVPSSVPRVANTIAQRSVPAFPDILDNNWDDLQWLLKVKKRRKEDDGNSQQEQQLFCSEKFSKDMHEFLPEILREERIVG